MWQLLVIADLAGLTTAFVLTETVFYPSGSHNRVSTRQEATLFLLSCAIWIFFAKSYGLYDQDRKRASHGTVDEFGALFHVMMVGTLIILFGSSITGWANPYPPKLAVFAALGFFCRDITAGWCPRDIEASDR